MIDSRKHTFILQSSAGGLGQELLLKKAQQHKCLHTRLPGVELYFDPACCYLTRMPRAEEESPFGEAAQNLVEFASSQKCTNEHF